MAISLRSLSEEIRRHCRDQSLDELPRYWDMARRLLGDALIKSAFVKLQEDYGNVAVLTEDFLVDIEGDDEQETGFVTFYHVGQFDTWSLLWGPLDELDESDKNTLVLTMSSASEGEVIGPYWTASDEDLHKRLIEFATAVRESIKSQGKTVAQHS